MCAHARGDSARTRFHLNISISVSFSRRDLMCALDFSIEQHYKMLVRVS